MNLDRDVSSGTVEQVASTGPKELSAFFGDSAVRKLLSVVLLLWVLIPFGVWAFLHFVRDAEVAKAGQVGDTFGVVNALFSGCAFAILVLTMWLQRRQLELQMEELRLTRTELMRSAAAQEESENALSQQVELQALASYLTVTASLLNGAGVKRGDYEKELEFLRRRLQDKLNAAENASFRISADAIAKIPVEANSPGEKSPFSKQDILEEFKNINDFTQQQVVGELDRIHRLLRIGGIVTRGQLKQLVRSEEVLNKIRELYHEELKRKEGNNLDPIAVAAWAPPLFFHGFDAGVLNWLREQLRKSEEYRRSTSVQ